MEEYTDFDYLQAKKDFENAKLNESKAAIKNFFNKLQKKVLKRNELSSIFAEMKEPWKISHNISFPIFEDFVTSELPLKLTVLQSSYGTEEKRYFWQNPSVFDVALSLRPNSYLCHNSAVFLHHFREKIPESIYLNYEQSPKPQPKGILSQEGIDRAFTNKQRESKLYYNYDGIKIFIVNGKNTKNLAVEELKYQKVTLQVTSIARTLIDISVRPAYSGGVSGVLEAFERAREKVSVSNLVEILKRLDYVYPYHQAIGFYMERAGFSKKQWSKLLDFGTKLDFYLANNLPKKRKFDQKWRIFYPEGL